MQALACEVARAFTKFGIAIAAKRPMMATTIMISTSVKPALRRFLVVFILLFAFFLWHGVNEQQAGLYDYNFVHLIACCIRDSIVLAASMPLSRIIINTLFTAT